MQDKNHDSFKLQDVNKDSPFIIPGSYLDRLQDDIMEKVRKKEPMKDSSSRRNNIIRIIKPQLAFAAGFMAFAFILYSVVNFILSRNEDIPATYHNSTELMEYTSSKVNVNMLYEYIESGLQGTISQDHEDMTDIIIDYLIKENIGYGMILME